MDELDYRERLAHDIDRWQREGLISGEQARQILARYGAGDRRLVGALRFGWLVTAVSIIGALILAAGVVLLFAANWEDMPGWFRSAAIIGGMLAAYGAGYALIYRYDMQRIGSALLLLGVLLYQAGLFLIAGIYDMPGDNPHLLLLASVGALPVAYMFGSRIVLLIAIGWGLAWVAAALSDRFDQTAEFATPLIIAVFGVALYATGRVHGLRASMVRFGEIYMLAGTLVTLGLVYFFTFDEPWREIIDDTEPYAAPGIVYASIAIATALVAAGAWLGRSSVERQIESGMLVALLSLAAIVATWPAWTGYAVIFNAVFFGVAAAVVVRGYVRGDERYINSGLALVGIGLVTRYIDVFWSMLATSAFFMIGGVLLLLVAYALERFRRGLIASMNEQPAGPDDAGDAPDGGKPRAAPA